MSTPMPLVDLVALRSVTGYERAADIEKCLQRQGIRYFQGKDGVWTTMDLINAAGGVQPGSSASNADPYSPDLV